MIVELDFEDIDTLISALEYGKLRVNADMETPSSVRDTNVFRIESALEKLRRARQEFNEDSSSAASRSQKLR